MKIGDVKIYELTPDVLSYYKKNVKGNQGISEGQATLKLSRNIKLAKWLNYDFTKVTSTYVYGNMKITVRGNKVIALHNSMENAQKDWQCDKKEYQRINKLLGIADDKFKKATSRKR